VWFTPVVPPVSLTPVTNLPPVSTTLEKLVAKFSASVVYTVGNIFLSLTEVENLPPVSLTCDISANFRKNLKQS
jgi:hypothetical protein